MTYTFNVPETKVEPFTSTRYETITDEVSEEYTVQVPVVTTKSVQVQVCRMVPKLVPVTIYHHRLLSKLVVLMDVAVSVSRRIWHRLIRQVAAVVVPRLRRMPLNGSMKN